MEGQPNTQESKQEVIRQTKDRIEAVGEEIDNFLEKSAAADTYNQLLHLQAKTPALDEIPVLGELESHPDVTFFKNLLRLKQWYEESLELAEREN